MNAHRTLGLLLTSSLLVAGAAACGGTPAGQEVGHSEAAVSQSGSGSIGTLGLRLALQNVGLDTWSVAFSKATTPTPHGVLTFTVPQVLANLVSKGKTTIPVNIPISYATTDSHGNNDVAYLDSLSFDPAILDADKHPNGMAVNIEGTKIHLTLQLQFSGSLSIGSIWVSNPTISSAGFVPLDVYAHIESWDQVTVDSVTIGPNINVSGCTELLLKSCNDDVKSNILAFLAAETGRPIVGTIQGYLDGLGSDGTSPPTGTIPIVRQFLSTYANSQLGHLPSAPAVPAGESFTPADAGGGTAGPWAYLADTVSTSSDTIWYQATRLQLTPAPTGCTTALVCDRGDWGVDITCTNNDGSAYSQWVSSSTLAFDGSTHTFQACAQETTVGTTCAPVPVVLTPKPSTCVPLPPIVPPTSTPPKCSAGFHYCNNMCMPLSTPCFVRAQL